MNPFPPATTLDLATPIDFDQLEVRLQGKLGGRIRDLHLLHLDCGIILRGFARTYHAKQLAQHVLMTETQMPILANEIEVC
jgi:hypothetical protein